MFESLSNSTKTPNFQAFCMLHVLILLKLSITTSGLYESAKASDLGILLACFGIEFDLPTASSSGKRETVEWLSILHYFFSSKKNHIETGAQNLIGIKGVQILEICIIVCSVLSSSLVS